MEQKVQHAVNQRIKEFLNSKKFFHKEVVEHGWAKEGTANNYLNGHTEMKASFLLAIKNHFPELNMNWLFTGKGRMELKNGKELTDVQVDLMERMSRVEGILEEMNQKKG